MTQMPTTWLDLLQRSRERWGSDDASYQKLLQMYGLGAPYIVGLKYVGSCLCLAEAQADVIGYQAHVDYYEDKWLR
jgi:hypothetical protein